MEYYRTWFKHAFSKKILQKVQKYIASKLFNLKAQLVILLEFKMFFNFSIKSKILINFVELLVSKIPQGHFTHPLLTLSYL